MKLEEEDYTDCSSLDSKVSYPQPHNIHLSGILDSNPALRQREIEYLHARAKHNQSDWKSKRSRRLYGSS
jgi:hypothetical protein